MKEKLIILLLALIGFLIVGSSVLPKVQEKFEKAVKIDVRPTLAAKRR